MIESRGKLILPFRSAGGIFHNGTNRTRIKFHAALPIHKPLDKLCDFLDIFIRARHFIIKICPNLEKFIKFLVIFIQKLIIIAAANHNNLDLCRNRLRLQGRRNHGTCLLPHGIHIDFSRFYHAPQRLPSLWHRKNILRLHNQIAAVCLMEQTALYLHKIRRQIPEFAVIFHLAHQIAVGRVKCHNNRRPLTCGMVYNQIDLVLQRHILCGLFPEQRQKRGKPLLALFLLLKKSADIFQHILLHRIDISNDPLMRLIFFLYRIDMMPNGKHPRIIIQTIHLPLGFLIQIPQVAQNGARLFLHRLRFLVNLRLSFLAQIVIILLRNRFSVYHRHKENTGIRCFYLKIVLLRQGIHPRQKCISFSVKGMLQRMLLRLVFRRAKRLLQLYPQKLHQLRHILPKLFPLARRKAQRQRASGILEIINIAPVMRHLLRLRQPFGAASCVGGLARAGGPRHIDIVSLHLHRQPEIKRPNSPFLPNDAL